jgi:hypothetical protein
MIIGSNITVFHGNKVTSVPDTDRSHPSNANVNEWSFTATIRFMVRCKESTVRSAILWQRDEVSGLVPKLTQKGTMCNVKKKFGAFR